MVEACGFEDVWVGRNRDKREVVRVRDTAATDAELTCVAEAMDPTFYGAEFSPELAERFDAIRAAIARPRLLAEARARFAREPERGAPPERIEGESDIAMARRVETFCGADAAGAFLESGGIVAISPAWMEERASNLDRLIELSETLGCIFQASIIADLPIMIPGNGPAAP